MEIALASDKGKDIFDSYFIEITETEYKIPKTEPYRDVQNLRTSLKESIELLKQLYEDKESDLSEAEMKDLKRIISLALDPWLSIFTNNFASEKFVGTLTYNILAFSAMLKYDLRLIENNINAFIPTIDSSTLQACFIDVIDELVPTEKIRDLRYQDFINAIKLAKKVSLHNFRDINHEISVLQDMIVDSILKSEKMYELHLQRMTDDYYNLSRIFGMLSKDYSEEIIRELNEVDMTIYLSKFRNIDLKKTREYFFEIKVGGPGNGYEGFGIVDSIFKALVSIEDVKLEIDYVKMGSLIVGGRILTEGLIADEELRSVLNNVIEAIERGKNVTSYEDFDDSINESQSSKDTQISGSNSDLLSRIGEELIKNLKLENQLKAEKVREMRIKNSKRISSFLGDVVLDCDSELTILLKDLILINKHNGEISINPHRITPTQ